MTRRRPRQPVAPPGARRRCVSSRRNAHPGRWAIGTGLRTRRLPGEPPVPADEPEGYSLTYHGLVTAVEKRLANGWQAFASYTLSRTYGLQPSSGGAAGDPQFSSVLAGAFGRDPNSLTNARGRLPNDRPHVLRGSASLRVPRTGFVVAASAQHFSGKPWAASARISLPQGDQRVLLESRGSRRLSAQTLLDVRLSRTLPLRGPTRVELLLDVLNALNEAAEEALATDNLYSSNFEQPTVFVDPRRVMLSVRLSIGR